MDNADTYSFGYDNNGNIYVLKDEKIYMFEIDKDDKVSLFEINSNKITINLNTNNITYNKINKQNALHIKSIENAIDEMEEMSDEEKEQYTDIAEQYDMYKYHPEKRYYKEDVKINNSNDDYLDDEFYDFYDEERCIEIYENNNELIKISSEFDIPSFETLIINGDENSTDLIFRTQIINDQPLYRITIYSSGTIYLNIIGTKIVQFVLNDMFI